MLDIKIVDRHCPLNRVCGRFIEAHRPALGHDHEGQDNDGYSRNGCRSHWVFVENTVTLAGHECLLPAINACRSALEQATSKTATSARATRTPDTRHLSRTSEFAISRCSIFSNSLENSEAKTRGRIFMFYLLDFCPVL